MQIDVTLQESGRNAPENTNLGINRRNEMFDNRIVLNLEMEVQLFPIRSSHLNIFNSTKIL